MEKEIRKFQSNFEVRAEAENKEIEGVAAVVNSETDMGWYKEVIMLGAFDDVMSDDVRCLVNHNEELVLARTKSKTLSLWIDEKGNLMYRFKVPNRSYANDLYDAISTGDVDQSSFAFSVKEQSWVYGQDGEPDLRKIIKFERLYDVSPVTFPAYEDTTVAKRSATESNTGEIEKPEPKIEEGNTNDMEIKIKLLQL